MDSESPKPISEGLSEFAVMVSTVSLVASAFTAFLLVPSALQHSIYGGTAVLVLIIVFFQLLGFAIVGFIKLILFKYRMHPFAFKFVICSLVAVGLEILSVVVIPQGGSC